MKVKKENDEAYKLDQVLKIGGSVPPIFDPLYNTTSFVNYVSPVANTTSYSASSLINR